MSLGRKLIDPPSLTSGLLREGVHRALPTLTAEGIFCNIVRKNSRLEVSCAREINY